MKREIAKYVSECDICQRVKASHLKTAGILQPLPIPSWKWEDISLDFIVGLPNTSQRHDSIWVIIDRLTKTANFLPVHTTPAVAEPPELFRLKCASHHYTGDTNSTHFKWNNPLVCRVTARFNHGYAGSR
jgi:hypothetical protein